jgi:hypothetical protein
MPAFLWRVAAIGIMDASRVLPCPADKPARKLGRVMMRRGESEVAGSLPLIAAPGAAFPTSSGALDDHHGDAPQRYADGRCKPIKPRQSQELHRTKIHHKSSKEHDKPEYDGPAIHDETP